MLAVSKKRNKNKEEVVKARRAKELKKKAKLDAKQAKKDKKK
jgi:hypothetical protein